MHKNSEITRIRLISGSILWTRLIFRVVINFTNMYEIYFDFNLELSKPGIATDNLQKLLVQLESET